MSGKQIGVLKYLPAEPKLESTFGTSDAERAAARRVVARSALGQKDPAGDLTGLLDMLGLLDEVKPEKPSGCRVCGGELKAWTLGPKSGMKGCCSRPCRKQFLDGGTR